MKTYMILICIGRDRPGIADDVSTFLFERGANIEDSQMSVMGGRFAVMVLFSCDSLQADQVRGELDLLTASGLTASLHDAEEPALSSGETALPLRMDVTAMDHPGIVQRIVSIFHHRNVNILSLRTRVESAPYSGAPLFMLSIEAAVPSATSISDVKEELKQKAHEMNFDLNFVT